MNCIEYETIYYYTQKCTSTKNNRNFNYYISSPGDKTLSVTYEKDNTENLFGLDISIDEDCILDWVYAFNSPFESRASLNKCTDDLIARDLWNIPGINDTFGEKGPLISKALCKRTLLTCGLHFYTYIFCTKHVADILENSWENIKTDKKDVDINRDIREPVKRLTSEDFAERTEELISLLIDNKIPIRIGKKLYFSDTREPKKNIFHVYSFNSGVIEKQIKNHIKTNAPDYCCRTTEEEYDASDLILLRVNGRINDQTINKLEKIGVHYQYLKKAIVLYDTTTDFSRTNLSEIKTLYNSPKTKSCAQCVSNTFYFGCLARVLRIERKEEFGNSNILGYKFVLGEISYATHIGLKTDMMNKSTSYLSEDEITALNELDKYEKKQQGKLLSALDKLQEDGEAIGYINRYLRESFCTHGMNVSSNIETNDNYLIYTKRGRGTWDSSDLYCSANGVCEIYNNKVSFYKESVDCDTPKIGAISDFGNFGGELSREVQAELNIAVPTNAWHYYGFTVMGFANSQKNHQFPLHFNILASTKVDKTIDDIRFLGKSAVEKEENENISGIRLNIYKNNAERTAAFIKKIGMSFMNIKESVLDILVLLSVYGILAAKTDSEKTWFSVLSSELDITDWISVFFAILVLMVSIFKIYKLLTDKIKSIKYKNHITLKNTLLHEYNADTLLCKSFSRPENISGILLLMYQLYYVDKTQMN